MAKYEISCVIGMQAIVSVEAATEAEAKEAAREMVARGYPKWYHYRNYSIVRPVEVPRSAA